MDFLDGKNGFHILAFFILFLNSYSSSFSQYSSSSPTRVVRPKVHSNSNLPYTKWRKDSAFMDRPNVSRYDKNPSSRTRFTRQEVHRTTPIGSRSPQEGYHHPYPNGGQNNGRGRKGGYFTPDSQVWSTETSPNEGPELVWVPPATPTKTNQSKTITLSYDDYIYLLRQQEEKVKRVLPGEEQPFYKGSPGWTSISKPTEFHMINEGWGIQHKEEVNHSAVKLLGLLALMGMIQGVMAEVDGVSVAALGGNFGTDSFPPIVPAKPVAATTTTKKPARYKKRPKRTVYSSNQ